jgi:hypothetical protein
MSECSEEIQQVVEQMAAIIADSDSSPEEIEHASDTLKRPADHQRDGAKWFAHYKFPQRSDKLDLSALFVRVIRVGMRRFAAESGQKFFSRTNSRHRPNQLCARAFPSFWDETPYT